MKRAIVLAVLAAACAAPVAPAAPADDNVMPLDAQSAAWNEPVAPFRIAGDLYYVGAADVTSYLIATSGGLILIDSGFAQTAPLVVRNLETLGFSIEDVRIILTSQAHADHVGGVAELKRLSGAQLIMSEPDAAQMASGGRGDFAFGDRFYYPPATADQIIADGDEVRLGGARLRAHITPGHTRGCTTWTTMMEDAGVQRSIVFVCGVTAPGFRLVDNEAYPNIVADFRSTLDRLEAMGGEIVLGAHGAMFGLTEKRARLGAGPNPFVDPEGGRAMIARSRAAFETELARQSADQGSE